MAIKEQLKKLIELQKIDSQIYKIRQNLDDIPLRLGTLNEELGQSKSDVTEWEERLKKLQLVHKNKDLDLQTKEINVKKFQLQLYQVKTNKAYVSLEKEIEGLKADNSLLEEEIIHLLDEIDVSSAQLTQKKGEFDAKSKEIMERKKSVEEEASYLQKGLNELLQQRQTAAQQLDSNIMYKYETVLKSRNGLAVVAVKGDACQGCFMNLPPQVINLIQGEEEWVICEQCARILYLEEQN